jgi:hypothetical protein
MSDISAFKRKLEALKQRHAARDTRAKEVAAVRRGDFRSIAPAFFSDAVPRPIVANQIDVLARHASAALSPLPMISCPAHKSTTQADRDRADLRTKIATSYIERSNLEARMQQGADQFYCYGLLIAAVEGYHGAPAIIIEDSSGFYPLWDRFGNTIAVGRTFSKTVLELQAEYPDQAHLIANNFKDQWGAAFTGTVEVNKWVDKDRIVLWCEGGAVLGNAYCLVDIPNPLKRCTYVAVMRPGLDDEIRGALDDVVWVQLAKHVMENYLMRSVEQTVNAPWAVPNDVDDIEFGPNQVVRTNEPQNIRRIPAEVGSAAWAAPERLGKEVEYGAIVPEALSGNIDASVVTGKGVQQLMAGYSQQIAMAQQTLVGFYRQLIELCFEYDSLVYPDAEKTIVGRVGGKPYRETYKPSRDIAGDYSVSVEYGGVAGLDPNRALVFLLQGLGAGLFSKDYVLRNLPLDKSIDATEEQFKIQMEQLRDSLLQGLSGLAQSLPLAMQNGLDPWQFLGTVVECIDALEKKKPLDDILKKLLKPKEEPAPAGAPPTDPLAALEAAAAQAGGGGPEIAPGADATQGPGGRPDRQMFFAGLSGSGQPNLQAGVSRMQNTA